MKDDIPLTSLALSGGCGCKLSPGLLRKLLHDSGIGATIPDALLVGCDTADDAAVWRVTDDWAIVATTDFFSPIVDEAYEFGRIAATNALSDVYAMGGTPLFALAIAAMPKDKLPPATIANIFAGGKRACEDADAVIAGGHSIDSQEPLYGLAVIGGVQPDCIKKNADAQIGDSILLSKPLGVGVLGVAAKRRLLAKQDYDNMIAQMTQLNIAGKTLATMDGVHAMTDVTGFGISGHLAEVCKASHCGADIAFSALPVLSAAKHFAQTGLATGASQRNLADIGEFLSAPTAADWQRTLLSDPQTSGGLLIFCSGQAEESVIACCRQHRQEAVKIGTTVAQNGIRCTI